MNPFTDAELATFTDGALEALSKLLVVGEDAHKAVYGEMLRRATAAQREEDERLAALKAVQDEVTRIAKTVEQDGYCVVIKDGDTKVVTAEFTISVRTRDFDWDARREFDKNSRVYTWNMEEGYPALKAASDALPAPTMRGDYPDVDKAYDTFNRAYAKQARTVAVKAFELLADIGVVTNMRDGLKGNFSRYAGCTCPCSPAVIINQRFLSGGKPVDLHITFTK